MEMRYEEDEVFPDDLFYSFYYYSWQAVKAYQDVLEQVPAEFCPACCRSAGTAVKEAAPMFEEFYEMYEPRGAGSGRADQSLHWGRI